MLEQLSKTFDYWAGSTPEGMTPPRFNVLLCSRDVVECWRSGLGYVTEGLLGRLRPWYEDVKQKMPAAPGFNMEKVGTGIGVGGVGNEGKWAGGWVRVGVSRFCDPVGGFRREAQFWEL